MINTEIYKLNIETYVSKTKNHLSLLKDKNQNLTFDILNNVARNFADVAMDLTTQISHYSLILQQKKLDFEIWFSEKSNIIRQENNPLELSGNKWLSEKAIEKLTISKYKDDYRSYKEDILCTEQNLSFYQKLKDDWSDVNWLLKTLSENLQTELQYQIKFK